MCKSPTSFNTQDFYKSFKAKHAHFKLTSVQHGRILKKACVNIKQALLEDGEFKLGNRSGKLTIRMVKPKTRLFDYGHYNKTGEKRYFTNDHSDGLVGKVFWDRDDAVLSDKGMWEFEPNRKLSREIAQLIINKEVEYPIYYNKHAK